MFTGSVGFVLPVLLGVRLVVCWLCVELSSMYGAALLGWCHMWGCECVLPVMGC